MRASRFQACRICRDDQNCHLDGLAGITEPVVASDRLADAAGAQQPVGAAIGAQHRDRASPVVGTIAATGDVRLSAKAWLTLSGTVILWRLSKECHGAELSEAAEHRALRIIAGAFFALAAGVAIESIRKLVIGEHPSASPIGIVLTTVSPAVMPLLARAKRKVGRQLGSHAIQADATETVLCVWLSAIVLAGSCSMPPSDGGGQTRWPPGNRVRRLAGGLRGMVAIPAAEFRHLRDDLSSVVMVRSAPR